MREAAQGGGEMAPPELVRTFYETVVSQHRLEDLPRFVGEGCVLRQGEWTTPLGPGGMVRHLAALRETYPELRAWLRKMPTILETEHLLFVHGGVPSREGMETLNRWRCMKNDDFLGQGHRFDKYVVVGHWPVTLYHPNIPSAAPLFAREQNIISIDGGCVLKLDGQLNALIFPTEDSEKFTWQAYDGLPVYTALDRQEASTNSINIRWGRSDLELLEPGEEVSLCRHVESGRELYILTSYLRRDGDRLWCEDSTDYCLPVLPGDRLSLVAQTSRGYLMKKNGVTGWYSGRLADTLEK